MTRAKRTWDEYVANAQWEVELFKERFINEQPEPHERRESWLRRMALDFGMSYSTLIRTIERFKLNKERIAFRKRRAGLKAEVAAELRQKETAKRPKDKDPQLVALDAKLADLLSAITPENAKESEALARTFSTLLKSRQDYEASLKASQPDTTSTDDLAEAERLARIEAKTAAQPYTTPAVPGGYARDLEAEAKSRESVKREEALLQQIKEHGKRLSGVTAGIGGDTPDGEADL